MQFSFTAERVLQMPKESGSADDRPFREAPRNAVG
jgi:hypothetical protein